MWYPYTNKQITIVENIQRRATKCLPGMKDLSYTERLKKLDLPSLIYRRLRGMMIEVHKNIVLNYYDKSSTTFLRNIHVTNYNTRGHNHKLHYISSNKNIRKNYFSNRCKMYWNSLSPEIVNANSTIEFEKKLDSFWHDHPLRYSSGT